MGVAGGLTLLVALTGHLLRERRKEVEAREAEAAAASAATESAATVSATPTASAESAVQEARPAADGANGDARG